ncbi:MAG: sulfate ABC transporter permease subunit CysT [Sorangiineae bacterium NIC37A_2]|nr:MAG: sulfate ABC transporter permease subunit CysT [Sorangiineae bacterium NIC37A_2]
MMKPVGFALLPGPGELWVRRGIVSYIGLLVLVPFSVLVFVAFQDGLGAFWERITSDVALSAVGLTLWTGLLVGVLNAFFGTLTAWVLFRYPLPLKPLVSAVVDLPLSIPTLVAGVMLSILYGPASLLGQKFSALGIDIIFAKPGIILALLLVTLPFVVRAVEPVLEEVDPAEEEAAVVLGASPWRAFRTVYFPAIYPAVISGSLRSLGRAMGEFGSIVIVAGNIPQETLTAPVYIFGEIESGHPATAASVGSLLLFIALALHGIARIAEKRVGGRHAQA